MLQGCTASRRICTARDKERKMSDRRPQDLDIKQSVKDVFFTRNEYKLVTDYVIQDGRKHPFAVLVPGGGYSMVCSFIEGVPIARKLNAKGISAFIVYYRVRKKAAFPNPMDDLARGVREILKNADKYDIDPEKYSIWGASAGGHLVGSFGTDNMGYLKYGLPKQGALVLAYPVITLDPKYTHMGTRNNLIGKNGSKEMEEMASIHKHVFPQYPDTYIWCGDADELVDPANTKMMKEALDKSGVRSRCDIFPGVAHGVGPGTDTNAEGWIDKAVDFWFNK